MPAQGAAGGFFEEFVEKVWNAHNLDAFEHYVSRDVVFHPPRGETLDYDGYKAMAGDFLEAFPDLHFTVHNLLGDDTHGSVRLLIEGTNDGPWRGFPATGKRVQVVGQPQWRLENGKIVELWQLYDELNVADQLGHLTETQLLGAHRGKPR